ncbi:HD-GYP domain (HD superfamily hydrolase) [hydrothermal vent metagenome]|uniref:HD-GYP domain (HD superfamily hydrolase) n=1 Tax=hydrothermal vent metagenome TaxID=652676 RepID=A0A3B1APM2_9ZZZZ
MSDEIAEKFINELLQDLDNETLVLPTLPEVALRVRDTLADEDKSLADVSKIITTDAALSARLIQVSNSPLLRTTRTIDSVEAAVTRMGSNMVRNLVTSIVMEQMFQATSDATDKRLRNLWEHSTQVAAIASALTSQFTNLKSDMSLLGGLVHDIGALPILSRVEEVPEILENTTLLDKIISDTHCRIGERILDKWNFPPELVAVASEHENLSRNSGGDIDYVDIITVANLQSMIGSNHLHTKLDWNTIPAFKKLGLTADVNVIEMDETSEDIAAMQNALAS